MATSPIVSSSDGASTGIPSLPSPCSEWGGSSLLRLEEVDLVVDEEDFVSIQSDEDVQTAFETWREQRGGGGHGGAEDEGGGGGVGGMGEVELYCQR